MKQAMTDPLVDQFLDAEEQALEAASARGEYEELPDLEETRKMLKDAAKLHQKLHASKPVTIRIKQLDLIRVKAKAKARNVPYQTLLGALIRQHAQGKTRVEL
jgi:predicted DNA binding CopG/RHH family protein